MEEGERGKVATYISQYCNILPSSRDYIPVHRIAATEIVAEEKREALFQLCVAIAGDVIFHDCR